MLGEIVKFGYYFYYYSYIHSGTSFLEFIIYIYIYWMGTKKAGLVEKKDYMYPLACFVTKAYLIFSLISIL